MSSEQRNQRKPVVALILALGGFVAQTQLTQHVLTVLDYNRPFFVLYITQSVFSISLLVHLAYLALSTKSSISRLCKGLKISITRQLRSRWPGPSMQAQFPYGRFAVVTFVLTLSFTIPTMLWCIGISLSSASDVTVLWNANPFFTFLFSVTILGGKYQHRKFASVVLAIAGVALVVYGGSASSDSPVTGIPSRTAGNILALLAAVTYAGYQLLYDAFTDLPSQSLLDLSESTPLTEEHKAAIYPCPYGLESSFWTSMIGLCTLSCLWIAFPILNYFGFEEFRPPSDLWTILMIFGAAGSAAAFMTGTMMLLVSWGAIMTSVTTLLTIVLVFITDLMLGATITIWSIFGSLAIVSAFGILVFADSVESSSTSHQESNALL